MWPQNINEWSSSENQYDQQHYQGHWDSTVTVNGHALQDINGVHQFQQQQNNFIPQEAQPQTQGQPNLTSSIARSYHTGAAEFVPNNGMEQNTNQTSISLQSQRNHQGGYSSLEMLSDAVATLVFMPTKFERTSVQLAEKFNKSVSDIKTLAELVHSLLEACLSEHNFRPIAGRFCHFLANSVRPKFGDITFCSLLLEKFQEIHSNHIPMISRNPEKFRSLVMFSTDLYLQFSIGNTSGSTEMEDTSRDSKRKEMQHILASLLYQLFLSTLTFGKQDAMNLIMVIDMLKLSGKLLEDEERFSGEDGKYSINYQYPIQINHLMDEIEKISKNQTEECQHSLELRESLDQLVKIRTLNWQAEASDCPTFFDMPQTKGPLSLASTGRSHAIKIVNPRDESCKDQQSNGTSNKENHSTKSTCTLLPEELALTEAELRFMSEQMDSTEFEYMMNGEESDHGSADGMMPAEVEAAFEEFLNEQQAGLPDYSHKNI